jgi:hypothetical protein
LCTCCRPHSSRRFGLIVATVGLVATIKRAWIGVIALCHFSSDANLVFAGIADGASVVIVTVVAIVATDAACRGVRFVHVRVTRGVRDRLTLCKRVRGVLVVRDVRDRLTLCKRVLLCGVNFRGDELLFGQLFDGAAVQQYNVQEHNARPLQPMEPSDRCHRFPLHEPS